MRTQDYDPATASNGGELGQAIARKNARRGGTPNAPEVDDEPAMNTGGARSVGGAIGDTGQAIERPASPDPQRSVGAPIGQPGAAIARPASPPDPNAPMSYGESMSNAAGFIGAIPGKLLRDAPSAVGAYLTGGGANVSPVSSAQAAPAPAPTPAPAPQAIGAPTAAPQPRLAGEGGADRGYGAPVGPPAGAAGNDGTTPPPPGGTGIPTSTGQITRSVQANGIPLYQGIGAATPAPNDGYRTDAERNNAPFHAQLVAANTRDAVAQQQKDEAMNANARYAAAYNANQTAQTEARFANFRATNGADMILGDRGQYEDQRAGILAKQRDANAAAGIAAGTLDAAQRGLVPNRAPAATEQIIGETENRRELTGQRGRETEQQIGDNAAMSPLKRQEQMGRNALQATQADMSKLDLASRQRVEDLSQKVMTATKAGDIDSLSRKMAALLGKPQPEKYQGHVLRGEESIDPATNQRVKAPDRLVIFSSEGHATYIPLPSNEGGGKPSLEQAQQAYKEVVAKGGDAKGAAAQMAKWGYALPK